MPDQPEVTDAQLIEWQALADAATPGPCPVCGRNVSLDLTIREDEHKYPRPHWHARIECGYCFADTGWHVVSEQLADCYSDGDKSTISQRQVAEVIRMWNTRPREQGFIKALTEARRERDEAREHIEHFKIVIHDICFALELDPMEVDSSGCCEMMMSISEGHGAIRAITSAPRRQPRHPRA